MISIYKHIPKEISDSSLNLADKGITRSKGSMLMTYSDWNRCRFLTMGVNWYNLPEDVKGYLLLQLFTLGWLSLEEAFISSTRKDSLEVILR